MIRIKSKILFRVTKTGLIFKICVMKKQKAAKPLYTKEDVLKQTGERIRKLRIEKGYTSYEYFAYENNISRAQFGRYERGEDMRLGTLVKILNGLGMTLEEFFSEGFTTP